MDKIKFSLEDENTREIVREIFLDCLRRKQFTQLPYDITPFREIIDFGGRVPRHAESKFLLLLQEIFWELIIQGIITPGLDIANPNLPFFRVTEYGGKVLQDEEFMPHDPTNYLKKYVSIVGKGDDVVFEYLKESLRGFNAACYLSANMMLGIASERVFLDLCNHLLEALKNTAERENFKKRMQSISMVAKFEFVQNKFEHLLKEKKGFPSNIKTALFGIAEFLRYQRNDIGHPQDDLQVPSRDDVYVNLRIFPTYCKTIQSACQYFGKNKV